MKTALSRIARNTRGNIGLVYAIGASLFLIVAGLTIDYGYTLSVQAQMEGTADAAALAAATQLDPTETDPDKQAANEAKAVQLAIDLSVRNMPVKAHGNVLRSGDVLFGTWDPDTRTFTAGTSKTNAVKVTIRKTQINKNPVTLFFAQIINRQNVNIVVDSVATTDNVIVETAKKSSLGTKKPRPTKKPKPPKKKQKPLPKKKEK